MNSTSDGGLEQLARQLLERQAESRSLDYKAAITFGPTKADKAEVPKWLMAFANTRDGGYILIGAEQSGGRFVPVGVTESQATSFDPTKIGDFAQNYCSVSPTVTTRVVDVDGKNLLVLRVHEFDIEPIICTRDCHAADNKIILRAGTIYIRTGGARCVAIESGADMRALLDLAVEKRGGALLQQIRRLMGAAGAGERADPAKAYTRELEAAYSLFSEECIHESYWYLEVMPVPYKAERVVSNARLREIRRESVVSIRGWDVPHVDRDYDKAFESGIESLTHWTQFHEANRLYRSGLFVWRLRLTEDYSDERKNLISYESSIYSITELLIFASRYASFVAPAEDILLRLGVTGLNGRVLRSGPAVFLGEYETGAKRYDWVRELSVEELRATHLELATDAARQLFELYDLDVGVEVLSNWQKKFLERQF